MAQGGRRGIMPGMPPAAPAPSGTPGPRPAYWFPLLLFGGLAALSLPLSVLESPRSATSYAMLTREIYPTVTQAMYFGGSSASAPFPFPLGWYWGRPIPAASLGLNAWSWLDSLWRLGTFALLAVGVGLAILARAGHSRALAAITVIYLGAVSLAGWACNSRSSVPFFLSGILGCCSPRPYFCCPG